MIITLNVNHQKTYNCKWKKIVKYMRMTNTMRIQRLQLQSSKIIL